MCVCAEASQTCPFTVETGTERLRHCDKRQSKCICKCEGLLSLLKHCAVFSVWRPKLYLGHIKSNSSAVMQCYVNGSGNSLKHCTGDQRLGANTTKCLHHLNDLGLLAAITLIDSSVLAHTSRLQLFLHSISAQTKQNEDRKRPNQMVHWSSVFLIV